MPIVTRLMHTIAQCLFLFSVTTVVIRIAACLIIAVFECHVLFYFSLHDTWQTCSGRTYTVHQDQCHIKYNWRHYISKLLVHVLCTTAMCSIFLHSDSTHSLTKLRHKMRYNMNKQRYQTLWKFLLDILQHAITCAIESSEVIVRVLFSSCMSDQSHFEVKCSQSSIDIKMHY